MLVRADADEAATASVKTSAATAKRRTFIDDLLPLGRRPGVAALPSRWPGDAANGRTIGLYHLATARTLAHFAPACQDQFRWNGSRTTVPSVALVLTSDAKKRGAMRRRLRAQVRDEPVTVAAVDRVDELDDLAALGARDPLEQERGRVQRHFERLGLLLVRHRGLDRLHAAGDHDPVARAQEVVERLPLEV